MRYRLQGRSCYNLVAPIIQKEIVTEFSDKGSTTGHETCSRDESELFCAWNAEVS